MPNNNYQEHPFKPGVKVALVDPYREDKYTEHVVDKLHKNSNFTLVGDVNKQQWKAYRYRSHDDRWDPWKARKTGQPHYSRYESTIRLLDDEFLASVADKKVAGDLLDRQHAALKRVRNIHPNRVLTETQVQALESFVKLLVRE